MARSHWLRHYLVLAALVSAACTAPIAQALRMELSTGIAGEYSSNILRTERDREEEMTGIVWGGLSAREESANLTAEIAAMAESRQYINDVVGDEILLSLASIVDWMILPQRFGWHLEDYFQQSRVNPLETISPGNRQDTNVLWTGPDLYFRFAQLYTLQLGARYGNFYFEETNGDNQRLAAFARAARRLSPGSEVYAQTGRTRTEYDDAGESDIYDVTIRDFNRTDSFVGYHWESVLSEVLLEAGYTRIDRDGGEDVDGVLARLTLRRLLAAEGAIGIRLSRRLTEGSESLLDSGGGRLDIDPNSSDVTQDIARELYGEIFYGARWLHVGVDSRVYWRDQDYEESALDERLVGIALHLGYPVAPSWELALFGQYEDVDYKVIDRRDKRSLVGVGLTYRLSRRMRLDFELRDEHQQSTALNGDFNEVLGLVELRYGEQPRWAAR